MRPPSPIPDCEWLTDRIDWHLNRKKPSYYDSPANKDLLQKCKIASRNATITTLFLGSADALLINGYLQVVPILSRVFYCALPSFGSFGAFILGNALTVDANGGKDTAPCHSVGGFLFASIWACHFKRPRLLALAGVPLALTMCLRKKFHDDGVLEGFMMPKSDVSEYVGYSVPYAFMGINWSFIKNFDPNKYDKED
ncbi:putative NADH-ubiquinoe oxidoreductase subunit-like [Tropilaelaps mercedesae]|uniref:Putative NADH-ubiquinoe oxidoreductase subunit-like n=1 Tax=Tropilaelaps mercedesae TaxID=418985 RepID=A0A1V9XZR5_9ACAR|nr:putative NADH-ubiquinoe oxidoreductase subunit-like [Tropilaelaps mercedesae]